MHVLKLLAWAVTAVLFIEVLTIPLSSEAQIDMSTVCLILVAMMKMARPTGVMRTVAMALFQNRPRVLDLSLDPTLNEGGCG